MGLRGLERGITLAQLLAGSRGVRNKKGLPSYRWPMRGSGSAQEAAHSSWATLDHALRHGTFEEWLQNRSNRVPFNKIWLLSMRRLAQNLREIRMPADLANRFVANMTLLNAKKRAPIFDVLGVRRDTNPIEPPASTKPASSETIPFGGAGKSQPARWRRLGRPPRRDTCRAKRAFINRGPPVEVHLIFLPCFREPVASSHASGRRYFISSIVPR